VIRRRGGNQVIPRPTQWREGESPSWVSSNNPGLRDHAHVVKALSSHVVDRNENSVEMSQEWVNTARVSAVLVAIVDAPEGPSVILTRRADHLRNHPGQISFPGGRVEESESVHEAAVREAHEEINLNPENVHIIGELDPLTTFVSNSLIIPVVARVDGIPSFVIQETEVARVFVTPLHELAREDTYRNEWWARPQGDINIHFFELDDETVWGATGRILRQVIDVVTA
jgi:8-oxo-dGTP pyrophosphatase MutT (NUDIX family)